MLKLWDKAMSGGKLFQTDVSCLPLQLHIAALMEPCHNLPVQLHTDSLSQFLFLSISPLRHYASIYLFTSLPTRVEELGQTVITYNL